MHRFHEFFSMLIMVDNPHRGSWLDIEFDKDLLFIRIDRRKNYLYILTQSRHG